MADTPQPPGRRLDSWKEIAEYLGRNERTAMRWADTDGLPVRRIGNAKRRAVFAYTAEIDAWLARPVAADVRAPHDPPSQELQEERSQVRPRIWWVAVAASVSALALIAVGLKASPPPLVAAHLQASVLTGLDAKGVERFRVTVPPQPELLARNGVAVADLDGDGRGEVIAALQLQGSTPAGDGEGFVQVFEQAGEIRWRETLHDRYTFGDTEYTAAWYPDDLFTYGSGAGTRIAVASHHHTWWPSIITVFDAKGRRTGNFVNQGWIYGMTMTRDGRFLLAAGVSNAFGGSILAVLDADHVDGVSPQDGGVLPPCRNCPAGSPRAYVVVPWTDIARPSDSPKPSVQVFPSGQIEFQSSQRPGDGSTAATIVTLSASFEVLSRGVSDAYGETHARLEREGLLNHTAAACPSLRAPVRIWTPERGWRDAR